MKIGQVVHNNRPEQTGALNKEKYRSLILDSGSLVVKIYRRHIILDYPNRFPEHIFYEDNAIGNSWMLRATHFAYIPEPLYYYYQHGASTVHHITEERCRDRMRAEEIFYEECERRGILERYRPEIEYRFSELYYVITLFSYMQGVRRPRLSFVKELREGVEARFPDFRENEYYRQRIGSEERRLIAMQRQSDLRFFCCYRMKLAVRRMKAGFGKGRACF